MIRTNYLKVLPAALLAIGFASGAQAQSTSAGQAAGGTPGATSTARNEPSATGRLAKNQSSKLSHSDRSFVKDAAKGGMAEVELAKVAEQRASSPEVKQFAQRMMHDHSKANEQLRQIAQEKGVTMPAGPAMGEDHEVSKLQKLSGREFDRAYMDHMVKDHEKDVKSFKKEAQKAKDPDVRNFAQQTAPILEEHLQLARNADAAVGGKAAKKASNKEARDGRSGDMKTSMR